MRKTPTMRRLVAETRLGADDLIAPLFIREGIGSAVAIESLPGVMQHTIDSAIAEVAELERLGVGAVILFGVPEHKDASGSGAFDPEGIVQKALRRMRAEFGDAMVLIADLCVDEYTDHGHCGVLDDHGAVINDATVELYAKIAIAQAQAGADIVAPSGMMDGQVAAIRTALDNSGFSEVVIMAYAAKYASAFYGPFRDAVDVTIADGGDRCGYQQDPRNAREAMLEITLDLEEGADMVMVKPAGPYLDIVAKANELSNVPVVAYQVSGEYAMIKAAEQNGWLDGEAAMVESLMGMKRAGADLILTYFARSAAELFAAQQLALGTGPAALRPATPELESGA